MPRVLLMASVVMSVIVAESSDAAPIEIVRDGTASARIYVNGPLLTDEQIAQSEAARKTVPVDPEAKARTLAVRELNEHLQLMSGAALEVVTTDDPKQVKVPAIVLGQLAVKLGAEATKTSPSEEGFRLLTKDGLILIGGESDAGAMFGAYELLNRLGVEWVMPGKIGQIVPKRATVSVDDVDLASAPDFQLRRLWYRGYPDRKPEEFARMLEWMRRQKFGTFVPMALYGSGGHVWDQLIKRHKKEFDKDPTMLALVRLPNGTLVRKGPQIEVAHPRVAELLAEEIKDQYAKNIATGKWTKDTAAGFPIGPADGLGYSVSAESLAIGSGRMDPIGDLDRTDEVIYLANKILDIVRKDYPNAMVSYYAYSVHEDYPIRYTPSPGVVVIFAPINFSRFHSLLDANSKTQAYNKRVVEQWGDLSRKQGNILTYRGYSWNLAENMLPYTKVKIWGEELPYYKQQGVVALSVEGTKGWSVLGPSDFTFMKLAWDTSRDWKQILHDYCIKAYGEPSAPAMEEYQLRLIERQHGAGHEAGSYHAYHLIYDDEWIEQSQSLIDKALAAATIEDDRTRIGLVAHHLHVLRLYLQYHKATRDFDFAKAKQLETDLLAHWQQAYDQNTDFVCTSGPAYWKRFIARFVDAAVKLSSDPYAIVAKLPDELPTMFDPLSTGEQMQLFAPALNDSMWQRTKTFSSTWDAQGLGAMRTGRVWYRHRFILPKESPGKAIGLMLGSVDDEAKVWLNGKYCGTSGKGFSTPEVFDLTDAIRTDGENVLAIEIIRNSAANELGTGGIFRPSFIFSGPKIEPTTTAPAEKPLLPGGEVAK